MKKLSAIVLFLVVAVAAFTIRSYNIEKRTPHADEAEQAYTFLKLYEKGDYAYNPNGPHGPTLYFYALATQMMPDVDDFSMAEEASISVDSPSRPIGHQITINHLRSSLTPILLLILSCYLLTLSNYGTIAALGACACFGISSISCIYAGYFVHEIIFAASIFIFALYVWKYLKFPSIKWAMLAGLFAGLAQATKETSIIAFFATAVATLITIISSNDIRTKIAELNLRKISLHCFAFILAFTVIFCAFYSSFGNNPQGICDAFLSYIHFFDKAGSQAHSSPISYYFDILGIKKSEGAYFGEIPLMILAIIGFVYAIVQKYKKLNTTRANFIIFTFVNALVAIAVLCAIPYKMPWLLLSPIVFLCVAAGYGLQFLFERKNIAVWAGSFCIAIGLLFWQFELTSNAAIKYTEDPRNPMIYSHTVRDYKNFIARIETAVKVSNFGENLPVAFITQNSPWPAPWHLRNYQNIGFWNASIPQNIKDFEIVVCDSAFVDELSKTLNLEDYETEFFGLRKNLILTLFIKKPLFEEIIK